MAVDEKRAQTVFLKVVEVADPVEQAALLDRECALDTELRQRVESFLRAHQDRATLLGEPALSTDPALPSAGTAPEEPPEATLRQPSDSADVRSEDEARVTLQFLQPSTQPGSLGRVGHYEVLEVLGRGAFGIVVRAYDEKLQRVVAIKVLSAQVAATSPARRRFLREARAAARVRHENVVQIYAVEEQPVPYLVMEYIPGQTLQRYLDRTGPLDVLEILRIGEQIARGLSAAHEQALIHRDIKPTNILLEKGIEHVKITDFGLARATDDASLSKSGVIAGTPLFMAPEQAHGDPLDHRADLFSLGSVLYTMASGRPPFRAATTMAVMKRVADDTPRPIREIIPEVPQWLCDIIARLHAKDPAHRFQSAAEVADLLSRHLAHLRHPELVARPPTGQRRSRGAVVLAAAVGLLGLGALATYALWWNAGPTSVSSGPATGATPAAEALSSHVLQGRDAVRDALIDPDDPERNFGSVARDNQLRRADQCSAFLVHFDLAKLGVPPKARVEKATLSFHVWDPSSQGKSKVCAFLMKTAWDEETVTWRQPAKGKAWLDGKSFGFDADTGPAGPSVVVQPDQDNDTVDPPIEYQIDVTDLVRPWLESGAPNNGLAIAPVIDPSVDEGVRSRFQILGSEYSRAQYTPRLTVQMRR